MNQQEQERFDGLYSKHLQALKLQGKREKTIDGYARALRRIAGYLIAALTASKEPLKNRHFVGSDAR